MDGLKDFYYGYPKFKKSMIDFFYSYVFALMHVGMGILCFSFHFWILTGYHIAAIIWYLFVNRIARNNLNVLMFKMIFYELCLNVSLLTMAFGWDYGFYLYLLGIPASTFYCVYYMRSKKTGDLSPIKYCLITVLFFVFCYVWSMNVPIKESVQNSVLRPYILIINCFVLFSFSIFILCAFFTDIQKTEAVLDEKNQLLEVIASTDALTGVLNRRSMEEYLGKALEQYVEKRIPFCLVISDIDNFKQINDKYGHGIGDKVLVEVTRIFNQVIRSDGYICRWGGEEFLILLSDCKIVGAIETAERLRKGVEMGKVSIAENEFCQFTMTFGLEEFHEDTNIEEMIIEIDRKLYQGKRNKKNCIIV